MQTLIQIQFYEGAKHLSNAGYSGLNRIEASILSVTRLVKAKSLFINSTLIMAENSPDVNPQ